MKKQVDGCQVKKLAFLGIVINFVLFFLLPLGFTFPLKGIVKEDGVNVRADSTVSASLLGKLYKKETIDIVKEKYGWYKFKLPLRFNCYVASKYLTKISSKEAKVIPSSLNIRISPSLEAPIVGKLSKNQVVLVLKESNGWTQIRCYPYAWGWVHKKFIEIVPFENLEKRKPISSASIQKKKKRAVSPPPLAKGTLKKLSKRLKKCKANYFLENKGGIILLQIDNINVETLINKKVAIWGKSRNDKCIYVIVEKIQKL